MHRAGKKQLRVSGKHKKKEDVAERVEWTQEQKASFVGEVKTIALSVCADQGVVLAGVEYLKEGRNGILRIFIDKPGGVTLDDCSRISRELGYLLDVNLAIKAAYRLEVSSPGIQLT
jgi:ribosome maturation factor RimP